MLEPGPEGCKFDDGGQQQGHATPDGRLLRKGQRFVLKKTESTDHPKQRKQLYNAANGSKQGPAR
jgi:hypothetical protein